MANGTVKFMLIFPETHFFEMSRTLSMPPQATLQNAHAYSLEPHLHLEFGCTGTSQQTETSNVSLALMYKLSGQEH